jgi:hypothetical protein
LFGRGLLRVRFVITLLPQSTCPSYRPGGNWVCFAHFGASRAGLGDRAGARPSRPAREIGFVSHDCPRVGNAPGLAGQRLFQPMRGKLGSFGATGPSDGSAGAFAGPRPSLSVSANWVRLYQRSQRRLRGRPRPSPPAPVAVWKLALFRMPSFGVPRLRGSDWSFPPKGGTPSGPGSPPGSLRRRGRSPTRMRAGPLTTKLSKVVVSYLSSSILLPCYHTRVPITSQIKSWLS